MLKIQHDMRDGQAPEVTASLRRAAIATFIWALLFGLVSFYLGGGRHDRRDHPLTLDPGLG